MNAEPESDRSRSERTEPDATDAVAPQVGRPAIEDAPIGFDQLFEILKNERRRRVLQHLIERGEEVTLDQLAEEIAARETGKDVRQISSQERKRVYVGLYQCHLPKMHDYGAITYNKPRGRIEPGDQLHLFERYLTAEETEPGDSGWTRYHSTLSLAAAALLVAPVLVGALTANVPLLVGSALLVGALVGASAFRFLR